MRAIGRQTYRVPNGAMVDDERKRPDACSANDADRCHDEAATGENCGEQPRRGRCFAVTLLRRLWRFLALRACQKNRHAGARCSRFHREQGADQARSNLHRSEAVGRHSANAEPVVGERDADASGGAARQHLEGRGARVLEHARPWSRLAS